MTEEKIKVDDTVYWMDFDNNGLSVGSGIVVGLESEWDEYAGEDEVIAQVVSHLDLKEYFIEPSFLYLDEKEMLYKTFSWYMRAVTTNQEKAMQVFNLIDACNDRIEAEERNRESLMILRKDNNAEWEIWAWGKVFWVAFDFDDIPVINTGKPVEIYRNRNFEKVLKIKTDNGATYFVSPNECGKDAVSALTIKASMLRKEGKEKLAEKLDLMAWNIWGKYMGVR